MRQPVAWPLVSGGGVSGTGQTIRVNWPRCSSSRPLPPRPVTSYFAVQIVCSAPRLVSTVSRSRSPVEATNPRTRSSFDDSLIRMTPRPGPERKFTSSALVRIARASRVAAMTISPPVRRATPTISADSGGAREPAAGARARLGKRLQAEPQAVAVAGHRNRLDPRLVPFLAWLDLAGDPGIEAQRRDDALAVLQLEEALDRFAVAGGRRNIRQPGAVGHAEVAEERRRRARAAGHDRQHLIALAQARGRDVLDVLLSLHPAVARHDHDVVFFDDEVFGGVLDLFGVARDRGAARIAVLLLNLFDLLAHQRPPAVLVLQQAADLTRALALLLGLLADDQDLETGQAIDLELEDRVGLFGVEREPLDDLLRGVLLAFRLPDDLQDLVERVEDLLEALENMNALLQRLELVLEPLA